MGDFWVLLCLAFIATGLAAEARSEWSEENVITVDSPECEVSEMVLFCDYKGFKEEPLYIGPLQNSQIQKVFLERIKELYLDECVSVNISATRIQKISIKPSKNFNCSNFALSVKYSNITEIPKAVNQLYIEGCNVTMLKPRISLSKLLVISSKVQRLEAAEPLAKGTVAIIHSSEIIHFKRYTADFGSTLTIKETKINSFSPDAFEMRDGKIIMENSTLTGAAFQIKGSFIMTPVDKTKTTTDKSDIPDQSCKQRDDTYYYLFCFFLFLFLVSWVAFVAYIFNNKILVFFRAISTPDQPKEGPSENEQHPLVMTSTGNSKGTKSDNDVNKINDNIKTRIEMLRSQFDRDRERHAQEVQGYDADINKIEECLTEHFYHMEKLDDTERGFEALICDIISVTWNGSRYESKSEIESETDTKKEDPVSEDLSISGNYSDRKNGGSGLCAGRSTKTGNLYKTMKKELNEAKKELNEAVSYYLSQVEQRLSYLRGQQDEDAISKKYFFKLFKGKDKNEKNVHENAISETLSPSLKKSYENFWEKVKNKKEIDEIFEHTQSAIKDAILNFQVSTFEILVRFQENRIIEMRNNTTQLTTLD